MRYAADPSVTNMLSVLSSGLDNSAIANSAYSTQSDLNQAATAADARAFMADKEAKNMVKMAKMEADAMGSGGGGMGMASQALGAAGQIAGLFGGGGGGTSFLGTSASPGGSAGVAGIGGGSMTNPFLTSTLSGY